MEPIGYKETNKIKFCLHESGLFSRGLDRIVAQEISNNGDKVKYKIVIDNMPYLLEISKNEAASERIKRGSAVQRIMSRYNYAAIPFYVNPNGDFILTEYIDGFDSLDNIPIKDQNVNTILNQFYEMTLKMNDETKNKTVRESILDKDFNSAMNEYVKKGFITEEDVDIIKSYIKSNEEFEKLVVLKHSDIQPENILYNVNTGAIKLIDFEFADYGGEMYDWACLYNTMPEIYKENINPILFKNPQFIYYNFDFNLRKYMYTLEDIKTLETKIKAAKDLHDQLSLDEFELAVSVAKMNLEQAHETYMKELNTMRESLAYKKVI